MTSHLLETFNDGIATITLNRPEARNAMSGEMLDTLSEIVPRLAADPKVRVVVLTGAGGAFCAGGDVKGFASDTGRGAGGSGPSMEQRVAGLRRGMEVVKVLHEMPKPTVAIMPGPAAGAGLSLALACDLRFCVSTAKLTTAFSKIAVSGDYGGSYFLSKLVGSARARELYFSADVITGEQALALGIVTRVAPPEAFAADAEAYVRYLAGLPTLAVGYMKRNLNAAEHATLSELLDLEAMHMVRTMMTEDHKAASVAFVEKRPPVFNGR